MKEMLWGFFNSLNFYVQVIASIIAIIGFVGICGVDSIIKGNTKITKIMVRTLSTILIILSIVFLFMSLYFANAEFVPDIANTSYETAQQMLENKGLKYKIINRDDYKEITLDKVFVDISNVKAGNLIKKNKTVELQIVRVDEDIDLDIEKEANGDLPMIEEATYADVSLYLREVIVYKILDGGSKTPFLSRDTEIIPTEIKLFNKEYETEYTEYSEVRDAIFDIKGCLFSNIPCGMYQVTVKADGYYTYDDEIGIFPENLDDGKSNGFIAMNPKEAGKLEPFTITLYDENYNEIQDNNIEVYMRLDENDTYHNIEVSTDGRISNYGLLAANGTEFDVYVHYNEKDYFADLKLDSDKYSIVLILHNNGTTTVTTIEDLYWND